MKTLSLVYKVTPAQVFPPDNVNLKDEWLGAVKNTVKSEYEYKMVKVTYQVHDPEIEKMVKFWNGVVVLYYAIQNMDGEVPDSKTLIQYREMMLDELLGYNFESIGRVIRKRKSSSDFKTAQQWFDFLMATQEVLFDPCGFEFPNTEEFWKLSKDHGYDGAKKITIDGLRNRVASKLQSV